MEPTHILKIDRTLTLEIQRGLKQFDLYKGAIDGIPGKQTAEAWAQWKKLNYLDQLDIVGTASLKSFREDLTSHPAPVEAPTPVRSGLTRALPGISRPATTTDPIYSGSNFTWGEATKNFARIPRNATETANIIKMARYMDKVRAYLGNRRITITSWHRPEPINTQVGGVRSSMHVPGLAADFIVEGLTPQQVQRQLDSWHGSNGGLGYGVDFTHIDVRGHRARFNYGR